jgi:2-oxoglutarate dehydrogenase E2 component (dihydrolipoamide succinyltransferase)
MATEVTLPALGESVTEGTVTSWLKSVGDQVAVDEPLLEVSTDKVDTEIPSPAAGTLLEIKAAQDDTVEVGAVLAVIGAQDESGATPPEDTAAPAAGATDQPQGAESQPQGAESAPPSSDEQLAGKGPEAVESTQTSTPSAAPSDPQTDEGATDLAPSEQAPAARADARPAAAAVGDSVSSGASEVTLPALGESVTEGTVTSWLKSVGDDVALDEPLLEISTDKVDTEIPSPVAGKLLQIRVNEDETVDVGAVLAVIGPAEAADAAVDQGPSDQAAQPEQAAPPAAPSTEASSTEASAASPDAMATASEAVQAETQPQADGLPAPDAAGEPSEPGTEQPGESSESAMSPAAASSNGAGGDTDAKTYVTPLVRKLAAQHNVDLATLTGSGVGGRIRKQDVLQAAKEARLSSAAQLETPVAPPPALSSSSRALAARSSGGAVEQQPAPAQPTDQTPRQPAQAVQSAPQPATSEAVPAPQPAPAASTSQPPSTPAAVTSAPSAAPAASSPEPSATPPPAPAGAGGAPVPGMPSPLRGTTEKLSRLRRVIAARMVESLQTSAQLTTVVEVDVTAISRLRDRVKTGFEKREGVKLSFLPFFAKATVDALKSYPQVNASIDTEAGEVTYHDAEHLGIAVDTERGLLVPVIKDAGDLSIAGLARKIADLAARTRENRVAPDELSGGTFTLTNTGSRGALFDTPIINQPQVAILGTGTVVKRPVVISDANLGETIAVRQMVYLALTYDHRLVDGADAARFLTMIKQRLEEANFESELGV